MTDAEKLAVWDDVLNLAIAYQHAMRRQQRQHWGRFHDPDTPRSMLQHLANDADRARMAADRAAMVLRRAGVEASKLAGEEFLREGKA